MLSKIFGQLIASFGIFFRTIRAFFTRRLMGIVAWFRRVTNFSRSATKVAASSVQGAAAAVKKPTKREDYIETKRLFISKSFLLFLAVGLVLIGLFIYFIAWPFILSHFLTAHFFQEDSRIPDWSGKVVVYYDKGKHVPMYSGTLEDGVLQGKGMEYDEDGLLIYEGDFLDGVRSGNGICYDAGVLVYEGQFQNGVYEGAGSLYTDGALAYQGAFSAGVPNGTGAAYDHGVKCYEGSFADGLYHGEGSAYDPSGSLIYRGRFAGGLYDGEGSAYDPSGNLIYRGGFAGGLYDGDGTVYLANGDKIQSEFSAGVGGGSIQWFKAGRLWYNGEADDLVPNGFGTVYAASGKVIYAGEMDHGALDGGWLLTLTAQELREAFGEASVRETDRTGSGFLIINRDLGLTVLCTFRDGEAESGVYRVWFAAEDKSDTASLLPWADRKSAETWATENRDAQQSGRIKGGVFLPSGGSGGDWYQSVYYCGDYNMALISQAEESAPFQIIWAQPGSLDLTVSEDPADENVAQAQERLDSLLEALESVGGSGGDSDSDSAADPADVERLLALMLTPQDAYSLVNALTDYYVYGQVVEALGASQPLLEQNLAEQQRLLERGQGSQNAVDSAQDRMDSLDRQLLQYRVGQEQAKLIAENLTGLKIAGCDLAAVLQVFDVAGLDAGTLYNKALAYAKGVDAGQSGVDASQIELDIKTQILDLTLAYENVKAGRQSLERATAALDETTQAYATGTADKAALYDAQCGVNDAVAVLFQNMGAYTKLVNRLNDLSGGWLAEEYGWLAEPFGVIYDMALRQAQAGAEAEKQQPADPAQEGTDGTGPDAEDQGAESGESAQG